MRENLFLYGLFAGIFVEAALAVAWFKFRRTLARWLSHWSGADAALAISEALLFAAAGALSTWVDLWKPEIWRVHWLRALYGLFAVLSCTGWGILAKIFRESLKESLKARIAELETGLEDAEEDRNRWVFLIGQIRKLIERKLDRLKALTSKPHISSAELIDAWNPALQVHTILKSTHQYLFHELQRVRRDARLRLALYLPDAAMSEMCLFYSWDGENENCVHPHPERMKLVSAGGAQSEIVRTFHLSGNHQFTVVPDCADEREFRFWDERQRQHLRSLIALKYQLQFDGTEKALVLCLDCDEPNFFSEPRAAGFKAFLLEMLMRFEYELVSSELRLKIETPDPSI